VLIPREIEKRLGLATVLSRHIPDDRDGRRVRHSYSDMTRARMFAIASGHEDCDDLDVLRSDPALKMACGRLPVSGTDLMSQPTLSRPENAPCWRQLARMGLELIDLFCARFERVPRCIVLDIDDTDDAVHGQQQLALFNTHAGDYCFQPIIEATTGRPVLSLLRPGKRPSGEEIERILRHVGRQQQDGVAVLIGLGGRGGSDRPSGASAVLDHEGLADLLRHLIEHDARNGIGGVACAHRADGHGRGPTVI
jgi:hypothetical protein